MGVVIFDPVKFREEQPQFKDAEKYSDAFLQGSFNQAAMILSNKENSRVPYDPENGAFDREILLNLLTCHIATLKDKNQVGTITSASEGSVSASFYTDQRKGSAWFTQTPCGYMFWQMVQKYRSGGMFVSGEKRH